MYFTVLFAVVFGGGKGVKSYGPMHEVEIDVIEAKIREGFIESFLYAAVVGGPSRFDMISKGPGKKGIPNNLVVTKYSERGTLVFLKTSPISASL